MSRAVSHQIVSQLSRLRSDAWRTARYEFLKVLQYDMTTRGQAEVIIEAVGDMARVSDAQKEDALRLMALDAKLDDEVRALFEPGNPAVEAALFRARHSSSARNELAARVHSPTNHRRPELLASQTELGVDVAALTPSLATFWVGPLIPMASSSG